jgi:hypothetical protein
MIYAWMDCLFSHSFSEGKKGGAKVTHTPITKKQDYLFFSRNKNER